MERGSAKHGPRHDDELAAELSGQLGAGGHREEWLDPEPPADDDPEAHATPLRRPGAGSGSRDVPDRLRPQDPAPARGRDENAGDGSAGPPESGASDAEG
ncbi:hypothetical protein [Pseudonocardia asaccharolytica]|uniref:Uncharacterized protein n=1 Tax=Pseudonocardia asaccharolytica DSM 44247 = NBRC 16224 TaxID=1123024 RepID=A0A511D586_9PSEU|nr:hypothetical protein [Pseudonocardia asaccharolytica]GEL19960.1 hypothetical protein PA7_37970 [Pseudonocardia asaccharolytica DSM 44247 = NBRC 16224]